MTSLADAFVTTPLQAPAQDGKPLSRRRRAAPAAPAALTSEVTALAQSLGVQPVDVNGVPTYRPDAFVKAIHHVHDALVEVHEDLKKQQLQLDARERDIEAREMALQAREERQDAFGALGELVAFRKPVAPRVGLLAGLFGRRG